MTTWKRCRKVFIGTLATSLLIFGVGVGLAQTVTFNPSPDFGLANGALFIATGDFNRDGKLDLAVPSATLLGNGNGTFGAGTNFTAGDLSVAVAVGDFNGDGKQDLAVANANSNNVSILLGVGDGTFGAATNFPVGSSPELVVVGDFNGDGRQDLAVTNFGSNNVSILLGNGSGGFAAGAPVAVGTGPFGLALGDFNGDGRQDLAVTNVTSNNVSILLGNGSGGFAAGAPVGAGIEPISVAVGDFNGDGRQDLAVANFTGDNVSIFLGNGSGGFAAAAGSPVPVGDGARSVAVGDFNGDGRQDLAVANFNSNSFSILLGNGNGTFVAGTEFFVGGGPAALALGDFNGDGKLDVVTANLPVNGSIRLGAGDGTFGSPANFPLPNGALFVAVGDLNRDGKLDLVVPDAILFGSGNGSFVPFTSFAAGDLPVAVGVGDFNGDGKQDLAVPNALSNNLSVLVNTAPPAVTLAINDVTVTEGNTGAVNAVFTVTLSQASPLPIAVNFATANGTAIAGSDYVSNSGVLIFNPGETTKPITVVVNGDTIVEPDQTFFVNLTNAINATITDGQGIGTIVNDDVGVPTSAVAAVLPSSRSVQVGTPATAFATIINTGQAIAASCSIAPLTNVPASFIYQTTDPATNQVTGSPNTPVDIAAGAAQSFVLALTPTGPFPPTDVQFSFACANSDLAPVNTGLNTLLLSASATPVPDIVALAATLSNDGIVTLASTGVFAVATVNVGATGIITASADTGNAILPVNISLCETNPATGQCISAIDSSVTTQINANATPTFGIFIQGNGNVPFDPAANRIFVRFKDGGGVTRGSTSVAVRTQ